MSSFRIEARIVDDPSLVTSPPLFTPSPPFCTPSARVVTVPPVFERSYRAKYNVSRPLSLLACRLRSRARTTSLAAATSTAPVPWLQPKGLTARLNAACVRSREPSSFALANVPANANAKDDLRVLARPRNGRRPASAPTAGATTPKGDRVPNRRVVIGSNTRCIAPQGWCHRGHVRGLELAPAVAWECHRRGSPRVTGWPPHYWDI
jgi:hypothetical protein